MDLIQRHQALLAELLPDDPPITLRVQRGQFHDVVVGYHQVVCFPRTAAAAGRLRARAGALRAVARLDIGVNTPEPERVTDSYLVTTRIAGEPLWPARLRDPAARQAVAQQLARVLTRLGVSAASSRSRASFPHTTAQQWNDFAAAVRQGLCDLMSPAGQRRAAGELAAVEALPHITTALVHGDLGASNVLWQWRRGFPVLSGIIDWDSVCLGDQATDLAAINASFGEGMRDRILALLDTEHNLRGRSTAIRGTFALQQALAGLRDDDKAELDDGLEGYR